MFKIADDPRATQIGRFLRRYSVDELPQLAGSFPSATPTASVGRGPPVPHEKEDQHVSDWGRSRLNLKPGITGPWQVLGT